MKYNDKNKPLVCMMTQSTCYKGTRKFTPKGVLWHSTGANNPTLKRYVQPDDNAPNRTELLNLLGKNAYGNDWNHIDRQAGLNFWIGKLADGTVAAVQTMPWDYRPWGCGSGSNGSCNDTHIQFEICEDALTDKSYWTACYKEACEMTAYLCKMFNIDPKGTISYNGLKVPTIIDHTGSHSLGLGSNHGDVQHWSRKYGVTMETVRNDVAALLAGGDSVVTTDTSLRKGSTEEAVKTMQTMLIACGYSCGSTGADGDFGKNTEAAVKAFQKDKGLTVDGVYGVQTKAALEKAYATSSTSQATIAINAEQAIWDRLYAAIQNPYGVAGVMGNFYAESALKSTNLQNSYEKSLGMTDDQYTAAVDNGSYTNFVHDSAGYGLFQATYWSIKESLLNYAKSKGVSIGDRDMQVDWFLQAMKNEYTAIWKVLTTATTVREASDAVLLKFERPADQSETVQVKRAGYGQTYYDKYAATTQTPVSQPTIAVNPETSQDSGCTAAKVIAVAVGEIGYKEKASNASLDDKAANAGSANYTKYARDFDQKYPNWYNGKKNGYAWCDMFVDWCFLTAFGYEKALKLLCQPEKSAGAGCTYSLRYYKNKGQFHTSGPKPGDQIFFGSSLDNSSHTGIVEKVDGSKVYTIEGNTSDQVARRSYALSNSRILGYGRPAYDAEGSIQPTPVSTTKYYRVRKSWNDKNSQIGAFTVYQNSVNCVDANPGYAAFDDNGNQVYPAVNQTFTPYLVRITISDLNYRKGPSTSYDSYGYIEPGVYTIVDEQDGWGLLKAYAAERNGWIKLSYTTKL